MPFSFRVLQRPRGEFVSVRLWSSPLGEDQWTNSGVLCFTEEEWLAFKCALLGRIDKIEVIENDDPRSIRAPSDPVGSTL